MTVTSYDRITLSLSLCQAPRAVLGLAGKPLGCRCPIWRWQTLSQPPLQCWPNTSPLLGGIWERKTSWTGRDERARGEKGDSIFLHSLLLRVQHLSSFWQLPNGLCITSIPPFSSPICIHPHFPSIMPFSPKGICQGRGIFLKSEVQIEQ